MVFSNNLLFAAAAASSGSTPFDPTLIGNSVWLDGSADYLSKTFSSGSAATRLVFAAWVQRNAFTSTDQAIFSGLKNIGGTNLVNRFVWHASDDMIEIHIEDVNAATIAYKTSRVFRDIGWYNLILSIDSNETDSVQLYINGVRETTLALTSGSALSAAPAAWGNAALHNIGAYYNGASTLNFLNNYVAQPTMLVGQSIQNGDVAVTDFLDTFTFGTNGSQFSPKSDADIAALATTAGGNSFCLDFANSSDLGNDISSNNNDFTPNSMAAANQTGSSPSSAFATWNPLRVNTQTQTFAEGNLRFSSTQTGNNPAATGSYGVSSGKFYWEVFIVAQGNTSNNVGICAVEAGLENDVGALYSSPLMYAYEFDGDKRNNNSSSSYGDSITNGDIVGVALDMDNGGIYFSKNGTFQASGDPTSGASLTNAAFTGLNSAGSGTFQPYYLAYSNGDGVANFGQSPTFNGQTTAGGNTDANGRGNFKYSVPSGYSALTSANITAPDYQGIDYFAPTLYEGNGTGQRVGDFVPFTDAFNVANSAMFQHDEVRALSRTIGTPSSTGGKKGTWSVWYKTGVIDTDNIFFDNGTTATNRFSLNMDASGQIIFSHKAVTILKTSADFKGDGAWHNVVLKVDTSLATAADRAVMFFDGVEITSFETDQRDNTNLSQNDEIGYMDSGATQFVGSYNGVTANQWDGYFAETIFLDNQFLSADSFGQLDTSTNKWVPKDVSGLTFGDQGFYLKYENSPTNIAAGKTGLKSDDLDVGAVSLLTDGTQYGSWNAGSNLVYQNANSTTKSWWGVDFGSGVTKTIKSATIFGNQPGDGSSAGFTSVSGAVTWTLFGSNSAQATSDNDLSSLTSLGTASVADGISKGAAVTIDASSNTTAFRYFYVQMNTTASLRRLLGEIQLYETAGGGIANDSSGQNNDLVAFGAWATSDQFIDTPSKNFATIDPVISNGNTPVTLSEGNLTGVRSSAGFQQAYSSFSGFRLQENTGIYFAEILVGSDTSSFHVGVLSGDPPSSTNRYLGQDSNTYGYDLDGRKVNNGAYTSYGASYTAGDVVGIEIDTDTGSINFHKNGSDQGQAFTDVAGPYNFAFASESGGGPGTFNFGQQMELGGASTTLNATAGGRFKHTPPTGAKALNQDNLDDTQSKITAWAWIKNRDATDSHILVDRVRGVGEVIHSNEAAAEATEPNTVQRFLQRGVQVGSDVQVNTANESYVLWQWLMGDSATTGTVNNDGSIASTLIAADAGHLSIGTYTGTGANATVGHGLGGAPEMIIVKDLDTASTSWPVYHEYAASDAETDNLVLNTTAALFDDATKWNDTAPTSTVFSIGTNSTVNTNTKSYFFITFRSVAGVCKVGSYVGTGSATAGPYIDLGFEPAFFMAKSTGVENWVMLDNQRPNYNPTGGYLFANLTNVEGGLGNEYTDFLSSGIKLRTTGASANSAGVKYIYLAMADIGGNGTLPPVYGR